jgi:hypothetical protein
VKSQTYVVTSRHNFLCMRLKTDFLIASFEVLTAVLLKIRVFWNVAPCKLVNSYRHFEGAAFLRSVGNYLQVDSL